MTKLEEYYNKFNEDKRLLSRHGRVEYEISMKYLLDYIKPGDKIVDIGAGTGRYSIPLYEMGYDVTALEYVQHNLGRLKAKQPEIKAYKGDARKLKRFENDSFDITILFGPMYHLLTEEDRLKALAEAKRVTKSGGHIFVAYVMNEYAVITYAFKEKHILENLQKNTLSEDFHTIPGEEDLYAFMRLEDIDRLNELAGLQRERILSPDGAANYIRPFLNALSEEEFKEFIRYQLTVCERSELLGAGAHIVDILVKD